MPRIAMHMLGLESLVRRWEVLEPATLRKHQWPPIVFQEETNIRRDARTLTVTNLVIRRGGDLRQWTLDSQTRSSPDMRCVRVEKMPGWSCDEQRSGTIPHLAIGRCDRSEPALGMCVCHVCYVFHSLRITCVLGRGPGAICLPTLGCALIVIWGA